MIKFFQFIKWCFRTTTKKICYKFRGIPVVLRVIYEFFVEVFKTAKESIIESPYIASLIWAVITGVTTLIVILVTLAINTFHGLDPSSALRLVVKIVPAGSLVLFIITCICVAYDSFEEEQQEILKRLKQ